MAKLNKSFLFDWKKLVKVSLWLLFLVMIAIAFILVMREKNRGLVELHTVFNGSDLDYVCLWKNSITGIWQYEITPELENSTEHLYTIGQIRENIGAATINDSASLNNAYNLLSTWASEWDITNDKFTFPIIGFSLMWFTGQNGNTSSTSPEAKWKNIWDNGISLAYSYIFITLLIAAVALILILINFASNIIDFYKNVKRGISNEPINTYRYNNFYFDMVTSFVINLALIFAFFNFLTTCLVLLYWTLLFVARTIAKASHVKNIKEITSDFEVGKNDIWYLIFVMIFQNGYLMLKNYVNSDWGVNLDLLMNIILPIGTITVIVGIFIKNLMNSKISSVRKKIKDTPGIISSVCLYLSLKGKDSFKDYEFVLSLPESIKNKLTSKAYSVDEACKILSKKLNIISFIKINFKHNIPDQNYLLYMAYFKLDSEDDLNKYYDNLQKLNNFHNKNLSAEQIAQKEQEFKKAENLWIPEIL